MSLNINALITEVGLFLNSYLQTAEQGPISQEETQQISQVIEATASHGSYEQKQRLYLLLIRVRSELGNQGLTNLQQPIKRLTRFFQQKCPSETETIEDSLIEMGSLTINNTGAPAA